MIPVRTSTNNKEIVCVDSGLLFIRSRLFRDLLTDDAKFTGYSKVAKLSMKVQYRLFQGTGRRGK